MKFLRNKKELRRLGLAVFGAFLYAAGVNLFIVPAGMYTGGFLGIGQVIRTILERYLGFHVAGVDLAGVIYYVINIPLFILAYCKIGKTFFGKTIFVVTLQTVFLTFIPTNLSIIKGDPLACVIVGGLISGYGAGLTLREGASGGGQDILGVYMMTRKNTFSVGKVAILVNAVVYTCCLALYNVQTVIYSLLSVVVSSFVTDRTHLQNVNMKAVIITKRVDLANHLIENYNRSATIINGRGGYLGDECKVIYTVLSKYEARGLENDLKHQDPDAFVVFSEVTHVHGNFDKHLE